jgi:hypothetical protein
MQQLMELSFKVNIFSLALFSLKMFFGWPSYPVAGVSIYRSGMCVL